MRAAGSGQQQDLADSEPLRAKRADKRGRKAECADKARSAVLKCFYSSLLIQYVNPRKEE
jgi:hypothetical protein